jgi:E3 ubiquitin-protein ligase TRIP12
MRHPECTTLRRWKSGPVKIDPLALVSSVERYMVMKGYARPRASGYDDDSRSAGASGGGPVDDESDDDGSDDELDDALAAMTQNNGRHRLEFLINGHVLPFTMTVYQAVRQYSNARPPPQQQAGGPGGAAGLASVGENSETDTDSEAPLGGANIWVQTHNIYYR